MIIDVQQNSKNKQIIVSHYDINGKVKLKKIDIPESELYSWKECKSTDKNAHPKIRAWNNKHVKKHPTKTLTKHRIYEFLDELPADETEELHALNYPSVGFVDIEVLTPEEGVTDFKEWCQTTQNTIVTISVVSQNGKAIVMGLKDLSLKDQGEIQLNVNQEFSKIGYKCEFQYIKFKNEMEMLHTFFMKIVPSFGLLTGWNFVEFDWTYLKNRYSKLGGNPAVASPTKSMDYKERFPSHVAIIDYAAIFAKHDRSIKVKENNTLDFVAQETLGINKVYHSESLNELYEKDFKRYVRYNVVDSILVHQIDERSKILELIFTISNLCKISIYQADMPTVIGDALLSQGYKKENKVITKGFPKPKEKESYEGAYVKKPIPGYYEWVAAFDFASLYPTTMRQFNISPEAFIEKLEHGYPEVVWDKMSNEDQKKVWADVAAKNRKGETDKIYCDNGVVYQKKDSTLKEILTNLYDQRKVYKKKMLQRKYEISELEKEISELEKTL